MGALVQSTGLGFVLIHEVQIRLVLTGSFCSFEGEDVLKDSFIHSVLASLQNTSAFSRYVLLHANPLMGVIIRMSWDPQTVV